MTHNRMRRRRRRRARAVDRCLLRYYRQKRIEEEVDRLLLPLDRFGDPSRSDPLRESVTRSFFRGSRRSPPTPSTVRVGSVISCIKTRRISQNWADLADITQKVYR